ncbi:MAG: heme ABC exporter ATP-binding protein CcmA [Chloroflexi bacterium]|uniref:Heme ABC exporter ATP-binding protein CcmA n=1 Tax=Candidatus Chlorohelix allophototropha TaxID=3003348 RepID=A0A8T7M908_9CHLR|nr:heme ABC exporter ATP-binding protein CcmA [Chloroflexota bacterium]WJW68475.1 heme ABC exporter ATP-binding protein CcmA [Chloroflexota bacterium L227-S17]
MTKAAHSVMIRAKGLQKNFGNRAVLRGVDLDLRQGEFVTLLGPNGAGKTTLLRILATLARPTSGTIEIAGIALKDARPTIRGLLGVISHQTFLYEDLNAFENLRFYGRLYDVPELEKRIREVLEKVGLERRAIDRVRTYSRGMQQRLSIARAILHNPPILLLDEPDTGLDRQASNMLSGLIHELAIDGQERSVLMTTHNLERGLAMCDRVVVLAGGKLVADRPATGLSADELQQFYFDSVSRGR